MEKRAKFVMEQLEKFSGDMMLPVNVNKTKALPVHSVVSSSFPPIQFKMEKIELS